MRAYFLRHWRGEASLAQTFFIFAGLVVPLLSLVAILALNVLGRWLPEPWRDRVVFGGIFVISALGMIVDCVAVSRAARAAKPKAVADLAEFYALWPVVLAGLLLLVLLVYFVARLLR